MDDGAPCTTKCLDVSKRWLTAQDYTSELNRYILTGEQKKARKERRGIGKEKDGDQRRGTRRRREKRRWEAKKRWEKRKITYKQRRYQALERCPSQIGVCDFKALFEFGSTRFFVFLIMSNSKNFHPFPSPFLPPLSSSLILALLCSLCFYVMYLLVYSKFPMSICRYPDLTSILTRLGAGLGLVNGLFVTVRMLARAVSYKWEQVRSEEQDTKKNW